MHNNIDLKTATYYIHGEEASLQAYETLSHLTEQEHHPLLCVYRLQNSKNGQWILLLIGETSLDCQEPVIQQTLHLVQAESITIPSEYLAPILEDFHQLHVEMKQTNQRVLKRQYRPRK